MHGDTVTDVRHETTEVLTLTWPCRATPSCARPSSFGSLLDRECQTFFTIRIRLGR